MHKGFGSAQGDAQRGGGNAQGIWGCTGGWEGMHKGMQKRLRRCTRGSGGAGWVSEPPGSLAGGPVPGGRAAPLPQAEARTAAPGGEEPRRGPAAPLHRWEEARSRDPRSSFPRPRAAAEGRARRCSALQSGGGSAQPPSPPRLLLLPAPRGLPRAGGRASGHDLGATVARRVLPGEAARLGAARPAVGCMQRGEPGEGRGRAPCTEAGLAEEAGAGRGSSFLRRLISPRSAGDCTGRWGVYRRGGGCKHRRGCIEGSCTELGEGGVGCTGGGWRRGSAAGSPREAVQGIPAGGSREGARKGFPAVFSPQGTRRDVL